MFTFAGAALAASGAVAGNPARFYESFSGGGEIVSLDPAITQIYGEIDGDFSNITVGGGQVYYQSGLNIYRAGVDLQAPTLLHTNGLPPTDIAVDASHGYFYESFAGNEVDALNTSITYLYNTLSGDYSNIAVGANKVYL